MASYPLSYIYVDIDVSTYSLEDLVALKVKNILDLNSLDLYEQVINRVEKTLIKTTLDLTSGNKSKAARILGINRNTLCKKTKLYKLF